MGKGKGEYVIGKLETLGIEDLQWVQHNTALAGPARGRWR